MKQGLDDLHQYRCLPFLRALFSPATLGPIRLHADAKRFLCAVPSLAHFVRHMKFCSTEHRSAPLRT